jgi:hypothetical protein
MNTPDAMRLAATWQHPPNGDDAAAIGNLLQSYAIFTDNGCREELAAVFTADATWDGTDIGYVYCVGPEQIADTVLQHLDPARPMVHLPGPPLLVRIDDDTVEAFSWCLATRQVEGVTKPIMYFSYQDVVVRTAVGWRFRSRLLSLTLSRS